MLLFCLKLPLVFLKFWFIEAPVAIIQYAESLNIAYLHLFSLPLLVRTFFKPLKNEYREGLVGFSIGMGIAVKTVLIVVDLLILLFLLIVELCVGILFVLLPFIALYLAFI